MKTTCSHPFSLSSKSLLFCLALWLCFSSSSAIQAQSANQTVLYKASNLVSPQGLNQGSDLAYYGATSSGGDSGAGAIFKQNSDGSVITLHDFTGLDGDGPMSPPIQSRDGAFYGTTGGGGDFGAGTIYKLASDQTLTTLHTFDFSDGSNPSSELVQGADGAFYGSAQYGGGFGYGSLFKITNKGVFTLLYSFSGDDGSNPNTKLVQGTDGFFYGTTDRGGSSDRGTVFKMAANGTLTTLHSFNGTDGSYPRGRLAFDSQGLLYGTTSSGGAFQNGTIFRLSKAGAFAQVHSFQEFSEGGFPEAGLTLSPDGAFLGTTKFGGPDSAGTVYKIDATGAFSVLHAFSFSADDGSVSSSSLILGSDGLFHGAQIAGGRGGSGTLYQISSTGAYATTYNFQDRAEIRNPSALTRGNDGAFYGTSPFAGSNLSGAVFKITATGALTILHSFNGSDGNDPEAALLLGNDGALYGTTRGGGDFNDGTLFKISADGTFTTLRSLSYNEDGSNPTAPLVQAADGSFIGSTTNGSQNGYGTIFKVTKSGVFTVLHSFSSNEGYNPSALVAGGDGYYYGTTPAGGTTSDGSIFRVSETGDFKMVFNFDFFTGYQPLTPLVQGSDGSLYGTTSGGGDFGGGTFFKITGTGRLITLLQFDLSNLSVPYAPLIKASDGLFYGFSPFGGDNNGGAVVTLTESGVSQVVYSFQNGEASSSDQTLVQDRDGTFYGSTSQYSPAQSSIFKLNVPGVPVPTFSLALSGDLAFGEVAEGATATRTLTIANTGNAMLNILGITYPPGFSGSFQGIIPAGLEQDVAVSFTPTAVKTFSGKLTVFSDATAGAAQAPVSGKGTTAIRNLTVSGDLAFGSVPVGSVAQKSFTISNSGNSPLTVSSIVYPPGFSGSWTGSVAAGSSQQVPVSFAPTQIKSYGGTITVVSNATSGGNTLPASGQGITATRIITINSGLRFGEVPVGTTASRLLTIKNTGNSPLNVQSLILPDSFYSDYSGTIAPGGVAKAAIYFSPFEQKNYGGTVKVQSDATSGTSTAPISGTGVAAKSIILLSGNLTFGDVIAGQTTQRAMTIRNGGNIPFYVYSINLPDGYSSDFFGQSILPNGTAQLIITFSPTFAGNFTGVVEVSSDATSGSNTLRIFGQGLATTRVIALSGDLAFGEVPLGTTARRSMTIANTGNSTLTVTSITFPPDFSGDWSGIIPAGRSQKVAIYFKPTRKKQSVGVLAVNSDRTSGGNTLPVSGTGK